MECMRTVGSLLAALLFGAPAAGQQRGIDVQHYDFLVALPDSGSVIQARAWIVFRRSPGADTIDLQLVDMSVDSVGHSQRPIEFTYDGRKFRVPLARGARTDTYGLRSHGVTPGWP